jgi:1,4-dihydroxy-6-naphthoate synthase
MTDITLGISPCPNDVFLFSGIILGQVGTEDLRFHIEYHDVEHLNQRAQRGLLDLIKISYANFVHCAQTYDLLSCGGALGRGCGPLLLSNGGAWDPAQEVLVPGRYTTANFLLDYFLRKPVRKRFLPFDALYERLCRVPGSQGVVIHEKRFTFGKDGLALVEDLGRYWEEKTGFAIPLGAIAIRKPLGMEAEVEALIRRSLAWAESHRAEAFALCRQHAQDLDENVIRAHIALYVNEYSKDLGADGRAAVTYFLEQQRAFLHKA